MSADRATVRQLAPSTTRFYLRVIDVLVAADVPFLIGGAYAFASYTGINRHTKDLDVFVHPRDLHAALDVLRDAGYPAELVFSHWLAKGFHDDHFVDVIFNSGNGVCAVDDAWFDGAVTGDVFGREAPLVPAEEMLWQKAFIMERERYDGADVLHLLRARGRELDWDHLLARFGPNWRLLLSHLVLFTFAYPDEQGGKALSVLRGLTDRLRAEPIEAQPSHVCRGALLSRTQYLPDIEQWGYADPRLPPLGSLTPEQVAHWTDAGR